MRVHAAAPLVAIAGAESWLTCPPSFDARAARTQISAEGPCESLMHLPAGAHPAITAVREGDRLKVGWVANNQADGLVRLAMVPYGLRSDHSAYDRAVLKVACYGRDCRPNASFSGFCSHPCNARGPWVPSIVDDDAAETRTDGASKAAVAATSAESTGAIAGFSLIARATAGSGPKSTLENGAENSPHEQDAVDEDMLRFDTTIGIPTNVLGTADSAVSEKGPKGGELYVLQLKTASADASVSYSCAMLEILPGTPPGGATSTIAALLGHTPDKELRVKNARPWHTCSEYASMVSVPLCMGADTPKSEAAKTLLANTQPGPFCYDGHADGDWDSSSNWPVNAACDPRGSCALAPSPEACAAEISANAKAFVALLVHDPDATI